MRTAFVWGGALLFAVSLASFLVRYMVLLRVPAAGPWDAEATRDAITNLVLFSVFALHHSIMARSGAKAWLTRIVPVDLERSVYVWVASVLFLAVCWLWQPLPGLLWSADGLAWWGLTATQAAAVVLTLRAARLVGIWDLAGVRQPDRTRRVEFTTAGPFGIVRHPIYLGWVLMVFAIPTMTTSRLLFAAVSCAYLVAAIPFEESSLIEQYGDKYRSYQRRMPWRLIPYIW